MVFCNNYVFPTDLEDEIFRMLCTVLTPGCRVIAMKPYVIMLCQSSMMTMMMMTMMTMMMTTMTITC